MVSFLQPVPAVSTLLFVLPPLFPPDCLPSIKASSISIFPESLSLPGFTIANRSLWSQVHKDSTCCKPVLVIPFFTFIKISFNKPKIGMTAFFAYKSIFVLETKKIFFTERFVTEFLFKFAYIHRVYHTIIISYLFTFVKQCQEDTPRQTHEWIFTTNRHEWTRII